MNWFYVEFIPPRRTGEVLVVGGRVPLLKPRWSKQCDWKMDKHNVLRMLSQKNPPTLNGFTAINATFRLPNDDLTHLTHHLGMDRAVVWVSARLSEGV